MNRHLDIDFRFLGADRRDGQWRGSRDRGEGGDRHDHRRYPATGQTATATITVPQPPLVSISVTPATATVATGATQALTVTATYSDASTATLTSGVTFVTSNPAIATVSAAGVVAGVAVGTATITARDTASGKLATSAITVSGGGGGGSGAFTTITFDSPSVTYTLTGFGGAEDSSVVPDPTGGANKVAKVVKSATAEVWAGTTVSTGPNHRSARSRSTRPTRA